MIKRLRPWHVVLLISLVYVLLTLARYNFDPQVFCPDRHAATIRVCQTGDRVTTGSLRIRSRAIRLNGWTKTDVPAYRYQRIVYPMAARVLALGNADLVPWTLILDQRQRAGRRGRG